MYNTIVTCSIQFAYMLCLKFIGKRGASLAIVSGYGLYGSDQTELAGHVAIPFIGEGNG